ncbi:MAG: hypothetical protein A4E52_00652 [Pelotomaculum sp. PtaB.Bin013]|nr:MAG: hypothetical protein A4E52_00652 [Pelotomaculum sp. PtaB.Bin013]
MPVQRNSIEASYSGKRRKSGETICYIANSLINNPGLSIKELSEKIGCTVETIRSALRKLTENPKACAAKHGLDENDVLLSLTIRAGIKNALKEANALEKKTKIIRYKGIKLKRLKKKWRGKANWPARKVATKKSLSDVELVKACGQHYTYKNGKYIINPSEIDLAVIKVKNKDNRIEQITRGRPTIPVSFTFK